MLAHAQIVDDQDPQVFLCQTAFQPVSPQCAVVPGVFLPQVWVLTFTFGEFHDVLVNPFLQPVDISLNGSTTIC